MTTHIGWWIGFNIFVLALLALDLGVFHRNAHTVKLKEALWWSVGWVVLALAFNIGIYYFMGPQRALEFTTGYVIERALSIDNIFVFVLLFTYFRVPPLYQHKVLFWGIIGALVLRAAFIAAGIGLIHKFHWMIYLLGALLIVTAIKMALQKDKEMHPERNPVLRLFRRFMPVTKDYVEGHFFARQGKKLSATPLFVALLLVETTDLVFAVDSIPAILAVTRDSFIVYTSNVFAIFGLRAMYFALAGVMDLFHYLHYGLATILIFVGTKMLLTDIYPISIGLSLGVIVVTLAVSVLASMRWPQTGNRPAGRLEGAS